jgi:hypothetical protein
VEQTRVKPALDLLNGSYARGLLGTAAIFNLTVGAALLFLWPSLLAISRGLVEYICLPNNVIGYSSLDWPVDDPRFRAEN